MGLLQFSSENAFQKAFYQLAQATLPSKKLFQQAVLDEASVLLEEHNGLEILYHYAPLFDQSGIFVGKPWENVQKLNPVLVRGTFHAGGSTAVAEALSELRILAIASGDYVHPEMSAVEANEFLTKVLALNIDLLLMKETEENRVNMLYKDQQVSEILRFISEHCFSPRVFQNVYQEINNLAVQRPIVTDKILKLITSARKLTDGLENVDSSLLLYEKAVYSPSDMSIGTEEDHYETKLKDASDLLLTTEAEQLLSSMVQTGLVSTFHAIFLNYINKEKPYLLHHILAVDEKAKDNLQSNLSLISSLITTSITRQTRRSIYGLVRLLQRDIFTNELIMELEGLIKVPIYDKIKNRLIYFHKSANANTLKSLLVSEIVSILGTPLGIGQGFNPTCQSTRALSYWAQKEPAMLLKMINQFLKKGYITIHFEGRAFSSDILSPVPLEDEMNIDAVSFLLIPHLDSIYFEMLKAADGRGQDSHKWINPAFHMTGIWQGFSDIYSDFDFQANFLRYYHPANNPDVNKELPQPAGITIYNRSGQVLGAHAVLIQRIAPDLRGTIRVYFYNPNNDSLQIWGSSIQTSVTGNGELEGESSLPIEEFMHFLYAFHYPI